MKIKVYLAIALVFLLGMLSGGLLVAQLAKSRVQTLATSSTEELSQMVLERLERDLGLSQEQSAAVSGILTTAVEEVDPLRAEVRGRSVQILEKYQAQIGGELDAAQRKALEEIVATFKKRSNLGEGLDQGVSEDQ
jgi:hypothetical protein